MSELNILIAEDSENDTVLIMRELKKAGYQPSYERVETEADMERALHNQVWDIVITDHNMHGFSSVEALNLVKQSGKDVPVIIVSGMIGENAAVEAMKSGAHDYIMKDNLARLAPAIERELRDAETRRARQEAEKALSHLSVHDSLTNLVNRKQLIDSLSAALMRTDGRGYMVAVLYIDLDRFKVTNDTYGTDMGDKVLQEVAARLRRCARYDDIISRYDGDEFIMVIENIYDTAEACVVAEMVIKLLSKPFQFDGHDIYIGASVGISFSDSVGWSADDLIKNAGTAMYQAKNGGRNNYQEYTSDMDDAAEHRRYLELSLYKAIELDELELYFQPQIKPDKSLRGAEVLLRWHHGTLGLVPPVEFIDLLEETGLIIPVGEWVLMTACNTWCQWMADGKIPQDSVLAVNISTYQFKGELVDTVDRVIKETGIPPHLLDLELTEGTLMDDTESSIEALAALKERGVQLSIDDFGTGYSSLSYLSTFPIDYLKIDKSFVLNLDNNENDAVIAKTIIGLAHNLGMHVIAEGVENRAVLDFLSSEGCDIYQGFLFAKPLPVGDFVPAVVDGFMV